MLWIILALVTCYIVGYTFALRRKYGIFQTDWCPYNRRFMLVSWAKKHYPHITPSYFDKQNKTYLISLWHLRPELDSPLKIYNKEVKRNGNDKGTII